MVSTHNRAAVTGRRVSYVFLVWALLFPVFLWMGRTYGYYSPLGLLGILGVGLFAAVVFLIGMFTVPLAVHEAGHLIAGIFVGFKPYLLILGPCGWRRVEGRLRFYWTGRWFQFSGLAGASPSSSRHLRFRTAALILGGPLASLMLAAPGARVGHYTTPFRQWLGVEMPQTGGSFYDLIWMVLTMCGAVAAIQVVQSLSWGRDGELRSDGSALVVLLRGGPVAKRYAAIATLYDANAMGVPPLGWPNSWIEDATCYSDESVDDAYGCFYAFHFFYAQRNYAVAGKFLNRARGASSRMPADGRAAIMLEYAFFVLHYDLDVDTREAPMLARKCLDGARKYYPASDVHFLRIEAAVLFAEGNYAAALRRVEGALAILNSDSAATYPGNAERTYLEQLKLKIADAQSR